MGKSDIFYMYHLRSEITRNTLLYFSTLSSGYYQCSFQCKIPLDVFATFFHEIFNQYCSPTLPKRKKIWVYIIWGCFHTRSRFYGCLVFVKIFFSIFNSYVSIPSQPYSSKHLNTLRGCLSRSFGFSG